MGEIQEEDVPTKVANIACFKFRFIILVACEVNMFAVEDKRKGRACIVIEVAVAVAAAVLNLVIIGLDLTSSYLD